MNLKPDTQQMDTAQWRRIARLAEVGVMTSALMHELRQPVFAIKAELELALARGAEGDASVLARLAERVEHLDLLVRRYADLYREGAEHAQLVSVDFLAAEAVDMMGARARQVRATLRLESGDEPCVVKAYATGLRQVLINLIANALDAVSELDAREVVVRVYTQREGAVRIDVCDSGPGFSQAILASAFEPFVTSKGESSGTGLGLYITRQIVEELGGTIVATNPKAGGAMVCVSLPQGLPASLP